MSADPKSADPMSAPSPTASAGLEAADVEAAQAAAEHRDHPVVRTLGFFSEVADQIPLATLCGAVMVGGLAARRGDLVLTGTRMAAAHVLANVVKRRIKNRVRRSRPTEVVEKNRYVFEPGDARNPQETSFPSGHTAGAVAVARIVARDLPGLALPGMGMAALIGAVQIPRARHYPLDVAAGAVLGLAAAWLVNRVLPGKTSAPRGTGVQPDR